MTEPHQTLNQLWADLMVEELVRNGVRMFCISPGSRSTPLTLAAARNANVRKVVHFDERGAAFCALGAARASGAPAALVCTSGTAGANYFPAIIEAAESGVPLVALTADRPPELLETGANQTIRQSGMFGGYPRWSFDMPCPSREIDPRFVLTTIDQAVCRATGAPAGPVHLNCPFREPLAPTGPEPDVAEWAAGLDSWREAEGPFTSYARRHAGVGRGAAAKLKEAVSGARRPVLAVGQLDREADRRAVGSLAADLGWPAFPDIASGLRLGNAHANVVAHFDLLLGSAGCAEAMRADFVLHLGGPMVSKRFLQWIDRLRPPSYVRVTDHPFRDDPVHAATLRVQAGVAETCQWLRDNPHAVQDQAWLEGMVQAESAASEALEGYFAGSDVLTEPAAARCLAETAPGDGMLFLGNSMPIRDMDRYAPADGAPLTVLANRGASGIDGNIATAAGAACAAKRPVTAVIGDLAALHDLNSFALIRAAETPIIIVAINNDGGGIFHFLPIAAEPDAFEPYFATPHGLTFERAAAIFELEYARPASLAEFRDVYAKMGGRKGGAVIEIVSNREENARLHREIDAHVMDSLSS